MEKWRCRRKNTHKTEINYDTNSQHPSPSLSSFSLLPSEKKGKKWSFGSLLKHISKNELSTTTAIDDILSSSKNSKNLDTKDKQSHNHVHKLSSHLSTKTFKPLIKSTNEYNEKVINNFHVNEHESQDSSINFYNPLIYTRNSSNSSEAFKDCSGNNSGRRNQIKARIKAKRERNCENSSSSDNEHYSNCSFAIIHSEDNLQNMYKCDNNRRTRGARTERYMKRLYRDDSNGINDHHEVIRNNTYSVEHPSVVRNKKKYRSDTLSPCLRPINNNSPLQSIKKMPLYYQQSSSHEQNNMGNIISKKNTKCSIELHEYNDKSSVKDIIYIPKVTIRKIQPLTPPTPPPRSSKSHLNMTTLRNSMGKNSDFENEYLNVNAINHKYFPYYNNVNCHSLDRMHSTTWKNSNHQRYYSNETASRHSFNGESLLSSYHNNTNNYSKISKKNPLLKIDHDCIEAPIVPKIQKPRKISPPMTAIIPKTKISIIKDNPQEIERKRHSKNLEEALQELEIIYNSLHLNNDEDLLDRAEKRSMDEYKDKIATSVVEGSIKSSSDTSSSYEMSHDLAWRHTPTFDQCHANDTRLKDDMAYRRIHQNERSLSVDPNQMSLSRYSYLENSPILSQTNDTDFNNIFNTDKPKSRRGTPDLMRDDVVFRTINHANNTLKIIEPQPPFGIPLRPVTTAVESDYLHIEPTRNSPRSLYIPQSEPDIISDDLAFRNLRRDTTKYRISNSSNTKIYSQIGKSPEMKKKRAVRSLSADLYGMINKSNDSQHAWYKEYVKLNRPKRLSDYNGDSSDNELNTNSWISNREYFDLDINGNRPKSTYQGRIQVCVPQENDKLIELQNKTNIDKNNDDNDENESLSSSNIDIQIPNVVNTSEPFNNNNNNELNEYKELCHNLECLINKISEKAKTVDTKCSDIKSKKSSLEDFVEWNKLLLKDDTQSMDNKSNELLKSSIENEMNIKQEVEVKKIEKTCDRNKVSCKLSDIHKELSDSPKNSLSLIIQESKEELKNKFNDVVTDEDTCTKLNPPNNVPYESSDITEVINNSMRVIEKNFSPKNNKNDNDDDDSSLSSIDVNKKKNIVKFDETKDSAALKNSTTPLPNSTNNNGEIKPDCIHESSISEGEEFGDECIASSLLCQTSDKQIVNVCLFNTNCLSSYYVALFYVFLTLLIAIIVAR